MSSGEDDEVDLSALATISETCREFRRLHEASDRAMAVIPRWYALCVNDAAVELGEAATAATRAAPSARLDAFLERGFAHESEKARAPEKLTSAIEDVGRCVAFMGDAVTRANEALGEFVEATSGRRPSDDGDARWIADVPVPVMRAAFKWGSEEEYTIEQWLWMATSVVEQLERELETRRKILDYVRGGVASARAEELDGCVALWSAQPFVDDRLFAIVCGDSADADAAAAS